MPIFDKELLDNISDRENNVPKPPLGSPETKKLNTYMGGFDSYGAEEPSLTGLKISDLSKIKTGKVSSFDSPFQMIPKGELLSNKRYSMYERDKDLENVYGLTQSWASQLGNGIIKMGATALGTFAQGFATLPNTISSFKGGVKELSGNEGYEADIDRWLRNLEDVLPNYMTTKEKEHPFLAAIPGFAGSANFWGDKIIKNIGFTVGAIGSALVQDAAVGFATEGLGSIPLLANQVGKASLWLNKVLTGTNRLEETLSLASKLGKTERQLLNMRSLAELAAAERVSNGFRYGLNLYSSARTEGAVEARDGYRQVKENLIQDYKLKNLGAEPTGADLEEINKYAEDAMNTRFGINMALLTVSNAIQFDNLFKSFINASSTKGVVGGLTKDIQDLGKVGLKEGSLDVFERKVPTAISGRVWDAVKPKLPNIFSEGVYEEGGQYAAERGTYDYYTRKYKNLKDPNNRKAWNDVNETVNSTMRGLSEQFGSEQGIENMLVGAISAMITGGVLGKINKIKGEGSEERLQRTINNLNQYGLTGILSDKYENTLNSAAIANEMQQAAKSGNIFRYKNLKNDMFFNFVMSRIPSGMHDVTIEQLNMLRDLPKEEFEKSFGMDFNESNKSTVNDYVDGLVNNANRIKKTVDSLDFTFKNPFRNIVNPENEEDVLEAVRYKAFNNWKVDLARYASISPEVDDRLNSIQDKVANINPGIDNSLIADLTDKDSLLDYSKMYEEEANQLSSSITEYTSPEEKRRIKNQVKALRTLSEKINIDINKNSPNLKTFEDLLNFELNGRDSSKGKIVPSESLTELFGYGHDVNKLNNLKQRASDIYDDLLSESGFDNYMKQSEDIASEEVPEEEVKPAEPEKISPVHEFVNKSGDKETPKVDREYELPTKRTAKVRKVGEDRFKVTSPTGEVTFYPTREKAKEAADEMNADMSDLAKVKVLALNSDGTVKVEDLAGNIQNISPDLLSGYERILSEEDKVAKDAEQINKEQEEVEKTSADIQTVNTESDEVKYEIDESEKEDKKRSADRLFRGSITESEGSDNPNWRKDPTQSAPHIQRARQFLNNAKNSKNRAQMRSILVTYKNEKSLGLDGLTMLSYGKTAEDLSTEEAKKKFEKEVTDVDTGFLAQVFMVQEGSNLYFVDKDGNKLSTKLGEQVDLNEVVFQTQPTTSLHYNDKKKTPRYRKEEKEQAELFQAAYKKYRKELFSAPEGSAPNIFKFIISRGIAIKNTVEVDGELMSEKNHAGGILVPEEKIATERGLVFIPSEEAIPHNGELIRMPKGVPVLQYGDTLEFLNNRKFTSEEAKTIYRVIKALADDIVAQSQAGKTVKFNKPLSAFVQDVLYWRKSKGTTGGNQFFIDETTIYIGKDGKYAITEIGNNEEEIINKLKDTFSNVNNKTLKEFGPFYEYFINDEDKLDTREWPNYQSYLLSASYPDGKSRSINATPLSTAVAKPSTIEPFSFRQKYSILSGLELPIDTSGIKPKPAEKAPTPTPGRKYSYDGTTVNTFSTKLGDTDVKLEFTVKDGEAPILVPESKVNDESIEKIAEKVKKIKPEFTEDEATEAAAGNLKGLLAKELESDVVAPQEAPSDFYEEFTEEIEASKQQDIEEEQKQVEAKKAEPKNFKGFSGPSTNFRTVLPGEEEKEGMTDAEIEMFKQWHAKKVPNLSFEVLDNIITISGTKKAFGMVEDGVAKFFKRGLKGTEYHEIFHVIFQRFLSPADRQSILDEMKERQGSFTDRFSNRTIEYAKATDTQLEDKLADEFADFRLGKIAARSLTQRVLDFFKSILEFFKSFVVDPSLKDQLFDAIESGKFKKATPGPTAPGRVYRAAPGLTEQQTHEFVQDMTARAAGIIYNEGDKKALFNPPKITGRDMFSRIERMYETETDESGLSKREYMGDDAWKDLVVKTKESLRTLGINFNEDDLVNVNDEVYDNRLYAPEPFSTDWKKSSPFAIKFTIGTLIQRKPTNQQNSLSFKTPDADTSDLVGGYKLVNFSTAFATLIDKLSNTSDVNKLIDKLKDLASYDANYVSLFTRLGGMMEDKTFDFKSFGFDDWRLFIQFYQTFTKQKPEALIQYKDANSAYTAPANLFTAVKIKQKSWIDGMKELASDKDSLIRFDTSERMYKVDTKRLSEISIPKQPKDMVDFLSKVGIIFPMDVYAMLKSDGANSQTNQFAEAVSAIYTYLGKSGDLYSVTGKSLNVDSRIAKLAELYVKVTNPNQDSTYFNVEGERTNAYSENNTPSVFENEFNEAETIKQLIEARPELQDLFNKNSLVLKEGGMFFNKEGKRIREIKIKYIQGTNDSIKNKGVTTSKLNMGNRFTQEINQNLNGDYYILIPADSSTEWMINLGNHISFTDFEAERSDKKIHEIFKGYLMDDIALALDADNRKQLKNVGKKAKELRFFKDILSQKDENGLEKNKVYEDLMDMIVGGRTMDDIRIFVNNNLESINASVDTYINNTVDGTIASLVNSNEVSVRGENKYSYLSLDDGFVTRENIDRFDLSETDLKNIIKYVNTNYIINNIEMHKIIFGDPYQFKITDKKGKIILDETKRIKSFLSPRRTTFDHPFLNNWLDDNLNKAGEIDLTPDDYGYQKFQSYTNTVTLQDVKTASALQNLKSAYGDTTEADAASWLMDGTYREIKIKNGQWSDEAEAFHQWQMAFTRQNIPDYKYTNSALEKHDKELVSKPSPKHVIEVLKPIVSGAKYGAKNMDMVLDKFSQMPIYYSMVKGTTLEKLYIKMFNEKIGYAIFESGRKLGTTKTHSLYNSEGKFNEEAFNNIIPVSWKSYGIQVETTLEGEKSQTRGSQLTKLSSMDLFENGVASDVAKAEYERNMRILNDMHKNAYITLLKRLGIEDTGSGFVLPNKKAISNVLVSEMLRREMSDNAKETIKTDENDQFRIPFEASPAYVQIRNIMYSLIDKAIISPKMSGGAHVQVPVTGFEKATKGRSVIKNDKGETVLLSDDTLKFYEDKDGQRYCEVMLPHWFKNKFNKKRFPTDESILEYLNKKENESILRGIGFRIPTQALSSVEVFKVKGFLPQYMGATVVVPSQITTKAGSDFDIDKLNMYLKSVYVDNSGNVRLIEYKGSEESTKDFYSQVFDKKLENKKINKAELLEAAKIITNNLDDPKGLADKYSDLIDDMMSEFEGENNVIDFEDYLEKELEKVNDKNLQAELKEKFVDDMYKKSLENEYYDSLEKLVSLRENFDRLISPVDDAGLGKLADDLDVLRGYNESNIKNRILDRNYMTSLRHSFVVAKRWVGIAAVNITNLSLKQKSQIYIDPKRIEAAPFMDKKILGDGKILLPHNTITINGNTYISLSGRTVKDSKELISNRLSGYATAFVDVAKDPYIMKIIKSDLLVGTFMFLENVGAGKITGKFLNQPIISEYVSMLDSLNTKNLFNDANIENIKMMFPTTLDKIESVGIDVNEKHLDDNIKNYYVNKSLTPEQNAEQQNILDEFLKYAKMAEYNFKFTQATNYDTTKFRSGDTLSRKQLRTSEAIQSNIISSVDKILNSTFIGEQEKILSSLNKAMGEVFILERDEFRAIIDGVLYPYKANEYMSQDKYEKIANKIRASFLDYIIQIRKGLNSGIKSLLVDANTSVAKQLAEAKKKYPNVKILNDLEIESSPRADGAKTIKLNVNLKDAYDENLYTGMMTELRDNPDTRELFDNLVIISLLQGTYQSAVSIKNIIPIEDYSKIVAPIMSSLKADVDIDGFRSLGDFQRSNFKDDEVMPVVQPKFFLASETPVYEQATQSGEHYADIYQYYSKMFPQVEALGIKATDRRILKLSEKYNSFDLRNEFIKIPRVVTDRQTGDSIDMVTGQTITAKDYAVRKQKGDMRLFDVFGYKKVRYRSGEPLIVYDPKIGAQHVYKLVNLRGDGQYATEHYPDTRPSVLNNGTIKIDNEILDDDIVMFYGGELKSSDFQKTEVPTAAPVSGPSAEIKINIYAGTGENAELSNFARRPFKLGDDITYPTVEHAFQLEKLQYSNAYTDDQREAIIKDMNTKSPAQVKEFGRTIKGLNVKMWNEDASRIMKDLIMQSFQANPETIQKLLATGNATLTHTQDKGKWGTEFPKLLMQVRNELRGEQTIDFDQIEGITSERKQEILTNFAAKHNMTEEQAKDYINKALQEKREEVINKLKECY